MKLSKQILISVESGDSLDAGEFCSAVIDVMDLSEWDGDVSKLLLFMSLFCDDFNEWETSHVEALRDERERLVRHLRHVANAAFGTVAPAAPSTAEGGE